MEFHFRRRPIVLLDVRNRRGAGIWLTLVISLVLGSCDELLVPPDEEEGTRVRLRITAALTPGIPIGPPEPNRFRAWVESEDGSTVFDSIFSPILPGEREWTVLLTVPVQEGIPRSVRVVAELGSVTGAAAAPGPRADGHAVVLWSMTMGPILMESGRDTEVGGGTFIRGRPEYALITGIEIEGVPGVVVDTDRFRLSAAIAGGPFSLPPEPFWGSLDESVASVDGAGNVVAHTPGTARIVAAGGSRADTVNFAVVDRIASFAEVPERIAFQRIGQIEDISVVVLDPRGEPAADVPLQWSVVEGSAVEVVDGGRIRAVEPGSARLRVVPEGRDFPEAFVNAEVTHRIASIEVTSPSLLFEVRGEAIQFTARALDAAGLEVEGVPIVWTSTHSEVISVSESGLAVAHREGSAEIHASTAAVPPPVEGDVAAEDMVTASLNVVARWEVAELELEPNPLRIASPGETGQLTVVLRDRNGDPISAEGRAIIWGAQHPDVVTVAPSGLVIAITAGTTVVRASHGGVRGDAEVIIRSPPTSLAVTLVPEAVEAGAPFAVEATVLNGREDPVTDDQDRKITIDVWEEPEEEGMLGEGGTLGEEVPELSGELTATTVDGVARFEGLRLTRAREDVRFRVVSEGLQDGVSAEGVLVTPAAPAEVQLLPGSPAPLTSVGATQAFTAVVTDEFGNPIAGLPVAWASSNPSAATVAADGTVTAVADGVAAITATSGGVTSDPVQVTVEIALPNLVLVSLAVEAREPLAEGDVITVTAEIANQGAVPSAATTAAIRVLDAETDAVLAETSVAVPALAAGATLIQVTELTGEEFDEEEEEVELSGSIRIEVELDPDDEVAESDESDNTERSRAIEVDTIESPPGVTRRWRGGSSDWHDPANWSPTGVPTDEDVIWIPASASPQPVLTAHATVGGLIIEDGASLDVAGRTLTVTGDLEAGNTITNSGDGSGRVVMSGIESTLSGTVPDLHIDNGAIGTAGDVHVTGSLSVGGASGRLSVGPHTVAVDGDFGVTDGARIFMAGDAVLDVARNVSFHSESTSSPSAGELRVGGDFYAGAGAGVPSFEPGGIHQTVFDGAGDQSIVIDIGGFNDLEIASSGTVTTSSVNVAGELEVTTPVALAGASGAVAIVDGSVTTVAGSELALPTLVVGGELAVGGQFDVNLTTFTGTDQTIPPLPYEHVSVRGGTASLTEATTVSGQFFVGENGATEPSSVDLAGQHLSVGVKFVTVAPVTDPGVNGGVLIMDQPGGVLDIDGDALFAGGVSILTDGVVRVAGGFTQSSGLSGVRNNFAAAPGLRVILDGDALQTISFSDPGPDGSHFGTLEVANYSLAGGAFFSTAAHASGPLIASLDAGDARPGMGGGHPLTVTGLDVEGLQLFGSPLTSRGGVITRADGIRFRDYPADAIQFSIEHPGAPGPFIFNDLEFDTDPGPDGETGFYMRAVDTAPEDGTELVIDLFGEATTPQDGSAATKVEPEGQTEVNWPGAVELPTGTTIGWTGALGADWSTGGNWSTGVVPTTSDVPYIPGDAGTFPTLSQNVTVDGLVIDPGGSLDLGSDFTVTVTGDVIAAGAITNGRVVVSRSTAQIEGTFPDLEVTIAAALTGPTTVSGDLRLSGALMVSNKSLVVDGDFTQTNGELRMQNSAGSVTVRGDAIFSGGNTAGWLTAGRLNVGGDFSQAGSSRAFVASGSHMTTLNGTAAQTVSFNNPSTSSSLFRHLEIENPEGVSFTTDAVITGDLTVTGSSLAQSSPHALTVTGGVTADAASRFALAALHVGGPQAIDNPDGYDVAVTRFTGTDQVIQSDLPYQHVEVHGSVSAGGETEIGGNLDIEFAVGSFQVGPHSVTVAGDLDVKPGGELHMDDANGVLDIEGKVTIGGGPTSGDLTAGTLRVGGDFAQTGGSSLSFAATGSHVTILDGEASQTVTFNNPAATSSRFRHLIVDNASTSEVSFASNVVVSADLDIVGNAGIEFRTTTTVVGTLFLRAGSSIRVDGTIEVGACTYQGGAIGGTNSVIPECGAFYTADFEGAVGAEWSSTGVSTAPADGRRFLGELSNQTVTLTLPGLPAHTSATVEFDLYALRSLDGNHGPGPDIFFFGLPGDELFRTTFANVEKTQAYPDAYGVGNHPRQTGAVETGTLGFPWGTAKDAVYRIVLTFPHTDGTLQFRFGATGLQALNDESWGLDNVRVTLH